MPFAGLRLLDLRHNFLRSAEGIDACIHLHECDLRDNRLADVNQLITCLVPLKSIRRLDARHNPFCRGFYDETLAFSPAHRDKVGTHNVQEDRLGWRAHLIAAMSDLELLDGMDVDSQERELSARACSTARACSGLVHPVSPEACLSPRMPLWIHTVASPAIAARSVCLDKTGSAGGAGVGSSAASATSSATAAASRVEASSPWASWCASKGTMISGEPSSLSGNQRVRAASLSPAVRPSVAETTLGHNIPAPSCDFPSPSCDFPSSSCDLPSRPRSIPARVLSSPFKRGMELALARGLPSPSDDTDGPVLWAKGRVVLLRRSFTVWLCRLLFNSAVERHLTIAHNHGSRAALRTVCTYWRRGVRRGVISGGPASRLASASPGLAVSRQVSTRAWEEAGGNSGAEAGERIWGGGLDFGCHQGAGEVDMQSDTHSFMQSDRQSSDMQCSWREKESPPSLPPPRGTQNPAPSHCIPHMGGALGLGGLGSLVGTSQQAGFQPERLCGCASGSRDGVGFSDEDAPKGESHRLARAATTCAATACEATACAATACADEAPQFEFHFDPLGGGAPLRGATMRGSSVDDARTRARTAQVRGGVPSNPHSTHPRQRAPTHQHNTPIHDGHRCPHHFKRVAAYAAVAALHVSRLLTMLSGDVAQM